METLALIIGGLLIAGFSAIVVEVLLPNAQKMKDENDLIYHQEQLNRRYQYSDIQESEDMLFM